MKDVYTQTITRMDTPEGKAPQVWANGIADHANFDMYACLAQTERAAASIRLELAKAAADADLVIESMAERAGDKIDFYKKLAPVLPEKTVLVTNSSSLLPSKFANYTGRPDRYLALHFANSIWKNNTAEIMAQPKTSHASFDAVMDFARQIRMVPLPVHHSVTLHRDRFAGSRCRGEKTPRPAKTPHRKAGIRAKRGRF